MRTLAAILLVIGVMVTGQANAMPWDKPRTAIVLAFDPEWDALLPHIEDAKTETHDGVTYVTGHIGDEPVVMALSGVSMVNAAMNTQRLLSHYKVSRIVMSGIAGGVDPGLNIGDIVVADAWSQPMETLTARETPEGYIPPAWLWGMSHKPNFGMFLPRQVRIGTIDYDSFPADPALVAIAHKLEPLALKQCVSDTLCLEHAPKVVVGGEGVSAASFVDNADYRQYLHTAFKARVTDMESAAVAQVAFANSVPFIAFRSLSDLAGGDADVNQMMAFMTLASENSASVVVAFVKALPGKD
ncbi:phosphorylase [Asticcacaulis sp. AC460]|uniref:5'-methylthioadenosine/S-adenosylhomocysteine nucleosidase n=1 Tax=Asticcacaulis sp. AC460 TaxID=1282360 RepID=UPI0003C3B1C4|nr:5'-methylthioadenosine/S-adenosylhomocysteine nucleosidase [Asticcacaulis sp. AC460]ESQ88617.1 phosphorylase [Asticcacaulis sp. AC460]